MLPVFSGLVPRNSLLVPTVDHNGCVRAPFAPWTVLLRHLVPSHPHPRNADYCNQSWKYETANKTLWCCWRNHQWLRGNRKEATFCQGCPPVSFGQRAPFYRASTRGSSPIRRTFTPSLTEMIIQSAPLLSVVAKAVTSQIEIGSRVSDHDRERDHERDRDRYRRSEYDMGSRNLYRRNYDKRQSRCQSRSSPSRNTTKEKTSSNLEKLKDLYGDLSSQKEDEDKISPRPSETEEVIRLGGSSWRIDRSSMFKWTTNADIGLEDGYLHRDLVLDCQQHGADALDTTTTPRGHFNIIVSAKFFTYM